MIIASKFSDIVTHYENVQGGGHVRLVIAVKLVKLKDHREQLGSVGQRHSKNTSQCVIKLF